MKRKGSTLQKPQFKRQRTSNLQIKKIVARADTSEKKNIDFSSVATVVFAQVTASTFLLNACAQGDTSATRSGRRTTMTSLQWRWEGNVAPTTTGSSPLRMLIIYDKQPNGAAPAVTDVVSANQIVTLMNLNNSRRFKILADENISDITVGGVGSWQVKGFRDFTNGGRKKGLDVEFKDASAGDITDITTGSIYALVWQSGGLLVASPTNALYTRVRFTDK